MFKTNKSKIAFILVMIYSFTFPVFSLEYNMTEGKITVQSDRELLKTGPRSTVVNFSKKDFTSAIPKLDSIVIIELPDMECGTLMLGNKDVVLYEPIKKDKLSKLRFVPSQDFETNAYFCFKAIDQNGVESEPYIYRISIQDDSDNSFNYINIETETMPSMKVFGRLSNDLNSPLSIKITKEPKLGEVSFSEANNMFEYTPSSKKTGTDSFEYAKLDSDGNIIATGKVDIKITKPASNITYEDMKNNFAHFAAVKLTERGILSGEEIAGKYLFNPDSTVTRGEFLVMLTTALGDSYNIETVSDTGFADDATIPSWLKGFIKNGVDKGIINGRQDGETKTFGANDPILRSEAAVMINNALKKTADVSIGLSYNDIDSIPTWAYDAFTNLSNFGVINGYEDNSIKPLQYLTKAEAAQLIYNTTKFDEEQRPNVLNVFQWFK